MLGMLGRGSCFYWASIGRGPTVEPLVALTGPLWWSALALMALNDHVFKAGDWLPVIVTGKLSDFTGMVVAPAVLAALLRVSDRRGWLLVHVVVAIWFCAMNLSGPFAAAWATLTAFTPWPWRPVVDAADLVALPFLLVSFAQLRGERGPTAAALRIGSGRQPGLTLVRTSAMLLGSLFLLANSPPPTSARRPDTFIAPIAIGNRSDVTLFLRVRALRPDVTLDCKTAGKRPSASLSRKLFAPAVIWSLDPGSAADFTRDNQAAPFGDCAAYLVDGGGLPMTLLFWHRADLPSRRVPGNLNEESEESHRQLVLAEGTRGQLRWKPHPHAFPAPRLQDPSPESGCELPGDEGRLSWSDATRLIGDKWVLESLNSSPDGCHALDLSSKLNFLSQRDTTRWILCLPPGAMPFRGGDTLQIDQEDRDHTFGLMVGLRLTGSNGQSLLVGRGTNVVNVRGAKAVVQEVAGCGGQFDAFGGLSIPAGVAFDGVGPGAGEVLKPGQAAPLGRGKTLYLVRAQRPVTTVGAYLAAPGMSRSDYYVESVLVEVP